MEFKTTRVRVGLLDFEYCASLIILHRQLDPGVVSQSLQMTPGHAHRAGDGRRAPKGTPLDGVYPTGCWSVELETRDGEDVAEFLSRVADTLKPANEFLRNIVDEGGEIECFVSL